MSSFRSTANALGSGLLNPAWDIASTLRAAFFPLFRICIYLIVILPSGTLFHVNVKLLFFALVFFPALHRMIQLRRLTLLHLSLLVMVPTALLFWFFVAQAYMVPSQMSLFEYRDIMIMLVSTWLIGVAIGGDDQQAREQFLRTALHAEVAACLLKVGLIGFAILRGIQVSILVDGINKLTGANLMGADFSEGGSQLGRIQFISDGLIPLFFFLLLRFRAPLRIRPLPAFVMFMLMTASLILSFSRYFWALAVLALILGITFGTKDRFYKQLLAGFTVLFIASLPVVIPIALFRFGADVAGGSDNVRDDQIVAMKRYFHDAPLLGHGLGSHTTEIIRSAELPYVYEVQLLAMAGQLGIVGMLLMGTLAAYYFYRIFPWNRPWRGPLFGAQLSVAVLLLAWFMAGLFNPMLLSSSAAVSYGVLKALGEFEETSEPHLM